jgi:1-aminocyclopropane-1-carboxylate deaminase/D-cysteine desulfhydrase-like pyridoxal-dependent ACC family enzyme
MKQHDGTGFAGAGNKACRLDLIVNAFAEGAECGLTQGGVV